MKKLARFATIPILIAVGLGLTPSDVRAGATVPGGICEYVSGDIPQYASPGINVSGATVVACAIPVDHQLGTTVTFRVGMTDGISDDVITCNGYVYSENGTQLNSVSPNITSSDCDGATAACKDTDQDTVTIASQSATHVYVVRCQTPKSANQGYSAIESVRAQ